jgi:hypothetical protein
VGFGEEIAGVDPDDAHAGAGAGAHVQKDGGFCAEGGGHDQVVGELGRGPLDDFCRLGLLEHLVQGSQIELFAGYAHGFAAA